MGDNFNTLYFIQTKVYCHTKFNLFKFIAGILIIEVFTIYKQSYDSNK